MLLLEKNFFDLLSMPRAFAIDEAALEGHYRQLVAAVHPDRFATDSAEQRRLAMQAATLANEAWRCLRDPVSRAAYLCRLSGVSVDDASRTGADPAFLAEQIEWRESLDEARLAADLGALESLRDSVHSARGALLSAIAAAIDQHADFQGAAQAVGRLMYVDKLVEQVDDAIDDIS